MANFLRMAINAKREEPIQVKEFRTQLQHAIELLDVDRSFTSRHLNDGFSGGEKKRAEILQMAMLAPDIAILDETDSGLDIDALRTVAEGVQRLHDEQGLGALIITHYQRILHYVKPQFVHILMDGRIVLEGGVELVERLEREGYDEIRHEFGARESSRYERARPTRSPTARLHYAARRPRKRPAATARRASTTRSPVPARATGARSSSCARPRSPAYRSSELPVWRRSGFWTTTLEGVELDALDARAPGEGVPEIVTRTLPDGPRAGRIVQSASEIVHLELAPELAERGVILCSLEDAFRDQLELVAPWYSKRLTIDRHKLEAANAAFWRGGVFLHVPAGLVVEEPFELVYAIDRPGVAQYGRTLVVGGPTSEFRVHEYDLASDFPDTSADAAQALHAGAFELYLQDGARCRLAQLQDWGAARCMTSRPASWESGATPTATGCRRCSAGTWCASTWSWRSRSRAATWPSAACCSPRSTSIWTSSRWTCTRPAPRVGMCTGAAPPRAPAARASRA